MAAYRMTVHKTTGVTPNMAMLGREVMMPAARPPEEPYTTSVPFVNNLRDTLRDAHRRVRNATRSSARTQKSYYDERAHVISFDVGQLVWLYWPRPPVRQRFRKLQRLWTGPWRIEAFKSPRSSAQDRRFTWTACSCAERHHQPFQMWTRESLPTLRHLQLNRPPQTRELSPSLGGTRTASPGGH